MSVRPSFTSISRRTELHLDLAALSLDRSPVGLGDANRVMGRRETALGGAGCGDPLFEHHLRRVAALDERPRALQSLIGLDLRGLGLNDLVLDLSDSGFGPHEIGAVLG
jgi:hypothetical protein